MQAYNLHSRYMQTSNKLDLLNEILDIPINSKNLAFNNLVHLERIRDRAPA